MATPGAEFEYRVRPVTRFIVTCFKRGDGAFASTAHGEFDNADTAYAVGYALAKQDADRLGCGPGDMRVIYPEHPDHANALSAE